MAFREVRINFYTGNLEESRLLNVEIGQPFTWYMDSLMRGRFKEYSGSEVKGINIVNLNLSSKNHFEDKKIRSGGHMRDNEWLKLLNTYEFETDIDLAIFNDNQVANVSKAINLFIKHAKSSNLPQMEKLIEHLNASVGTQSIEESIEKANNYLEKLYAPKN